MEKNEQWGVGAKGDEKAFSTVSIGKVGNSEKLELFFGEYPHSRQDNNIYARMAGGGITGFDGHRIPIKIEIEEYNYLKSSGLSGDQIRKGCSVKVFADGVQIYDEFARGYEDGYRRAHDFILSLEMIWDWFPKNTEREIGRIVGYREQLCRIKRFVIGQGSMVVETLDGNPFKRFLWEDDEDADEAESTIMTKIVSDHVTWFPKIPANRK